MVVFSIKITRNRLITSWIRPITRFAARTVKRWTFLMLSFVGIVPGLLGINPLNKSGKGKLILCCSAWKWITESLMTVSKSFWGRCCKMTCSWWSVPKSRNKERMPVLIKIVNRTRGKEAGNRKMGSIPARMCENYPAGTASEPEVGACNQFGGPVSSIRRQPNTRVPKILASDFLWHNSISRFLLRECLGKNRSYRRKSTFGSTDAEISRRFEARTPIIA